MQLKTNKIMISLFIVFTLQYNVTCTLGLIANRFQVGFKSMLLFKKHFLFIYTTLFATNFY